MSKRYLLVIKNGNFDINSTLSFYTLEEAKITAKEMFGITTIIDLEDSNIEWKGYE